MSILNIKKENREDELEGFPYHWDNVRLINFIGKDFTDKFKARESGIDTARSPLVICDTGITEWAIEVEAIRKDPTGTWRVIEPMFEYFNNKLRAIALLRERRDAQEKKQIDIEALDKQGVIGQL